MANMQLTTGFIGSDPFRVSLLDANRLLKSTPDTVLQVISLNQVGEPNHPKHRLIISDGERYSQSMLNPDLNHLIERGSLVRFGILLVRGMSAHKGLAGSYNLIVIEDASVIPGNYTKIGSPQQLILQSTPDTSLDVRPEDLPPVTPPQTPARIRTQTAVPTGSSPLASSSGTRVPESPAKRNVNSIETLNPFLNKYTIKALVTQKSDVKTFSKPGGQSGKLFNVTVRDETGDIRATAWGEDAEKFYKIFQMDNVYYISNGRIQKAKKQFNSTSHDCEIIFDKNTVVDECHDAYIERYKFTPLIEIPNLTKNPSCDVIGVLVGISPMKEVTIGNRKSNVREVNIIDQSATTIRVSLWGNQAENFSAEQESVLLFGGVKIKEFRGTYSLTMGSSSSMEINPEIPEAQRLRQWYDHDGGNLAKTAIGAGAKGDFDYDAVQCIHDVWDSDLGRDKEEKFCMHATIQSVRFLEDGKFAYPACNSCSKKTRELHNGSWICANGCGKVWERPSYRYIFSMSVADHSGELALSAFNEVGEKLIGTTADELKELMATDNERFHAILHGLVGKSYNFACKAKTETYNDQERTRYAIDAILPRDYKRDVYCLQALLTSLQ